MPHFGLMDPKALGEEEAALQRARFHMRAGKRRLSKGKISAGIVTLYDALSHAMQWNVLNPERRERLEIREGDDMDSDEALFEIMSRSGVTGTAFDHDSFNALVERALNEEITDLDYSGILKDLKSVMTDLGVMPFDESSLPPEDPNTF
jgi:hypothetical protein